MVPGRLDVGMIDIGALDAAIAMAAEVPPCTPEAHALLRSARSVRELRAAVISGDLEHTRLALAAAVEGSDGSGSGLVDVAAHEVAVVRAHLDHVAVEAALADALASGRAEDGAASLLLHGTARTDELEAAISFARARGTGAAPQDNEASAEITALLTSAEHILALRTAQQRGDLREAVLAVQAACESGVVAAASDELSAAIADLNNRAVLEGPLARALEDGGGDGPVGELDVGSIRLDEGIRQAMEVRVCVVGRVAPASSLIRCRLLPQIGCATPDAERLLLSALLARRLRAALVARNWEALRAAVEEQAAAERAGDADILPVTRRELARASAVLNNYTAEVELLAALTPWAGGGSGGVIGAGGDVLPAPTAESVALLDSAIAAAMALCGGELEGQQRCSEKLRVLIRTARVMRGLRAAFIDDDMGAVLRVLEGARDSGEELSDVVRRELGALLAEFDERAAVGELSRALAEGGPSRAVHGDAAAAAESLGALLDASGVSVAGLDAAMEAASALGCRTPRSQQLLLSAQVVAELRRALIAARAVGGEGGGSRAAAGDARVEAALTAAERAQLAPEACREVECVRSAFAERAAATALRAALARGHAGDGASGAAAAAANCGGVGALCELDAAIGAALHVDAPSAGLRLLMETAASVRALRVELTRGSLGAAAAVLAGLRREGCAPEAEAEVSAAAARVADADAFDAGVRAVVSATEACDEAGIAGALAVLEGLPRPPPADARAFDALVAHARSTMHALAGLRVALADATATRDVASLRPLLATAGRAGLRSAEVDAAGSLVALAASLEAGALGALSTGDADGLEAALASAGAAGVALECEGAARAVLALPLRERLQLALQLAVGRGDVDAVARATLDMKTLFFAEAAAASPPRSFALADYARVRPRAPPDASSSGAPGAYLQWQAAPLATSLLVLPPPAAAFAARISGVLRQLTGDAPCKDLERATLELVQTCLAEPALRDETLAQLMAQLTGCPSAARAEAGWVLLRVCLAAFPPSEAFENVLEAFLRGARRMRHVITLHRTVCGGAARSVRSLGELRAALRDSDDEAARPAGGEPQRSPGDAARAGGVEEEKRSSVA